MRKEDQARFPAVTVRLRNETQAVVRPLSVDDADALGDFYESVPREDFRFYCPHALTRERAAQNAAAALSPFQVVLVLEAADGSIGGYAWYRWEKDDSPKSTFGICIRRDFQGLGAGRALMTRLLEVAREFGPPVMSLTVQKANPRGVELYKKMGFRVVREQVRPANAALKLDAEPEYAMELRVR